MDDVSGFQMMMTSMDSIGMTAEEKSNLMHLTAAILHLGNITFDEHTRDNKGQRDVLHSCVCPCVKPPLHLPLEMSTISRSSSRSFSLACKMLQLEEEDLQRALVSRVMTTSKGGAMGTIIK